MTLYNQNNYANTPYPSPTLPSATVKSGGCGVCCSSTVLSYFGVSCPPDKLAPIFLTKNIRVAGGTDMKKAANYILSVADIEYSTTSDETVLYNHVAAGGCAIANVGGNRAGYTGVFSDGGHYIVVIGCKPNGDFMIHDVGYYDGKFNKPGRKGKVNNEGTVWSCTQQVLHEDTLGRTPNYYLFKRTVQNIMDNSTNEKEELGMVYKTIKDMPSWAQPTIQKLINKQALRGDEKGELNIPYEILRMYVVNDRMGLYGE